MTLGRTVEVVVETLHRRMKKRDGVFHGVTFVSVGSLRLPSLTSR